MGTLNIIRSLPKEIRNLEDLLTTFETDQLADPVPSQPSSIFGKSNLDVFQTTFFWRFYYKETFTKELVLENRLVSMDRFFQENQNTNFKCLQNESFIILFIEKDNAEKLGNSSKNNLSEQIVFNLLQRLKSINPAQETSKCPMNRRKLHQEKLSFAKQNSGVSFDGNDLRKIFGGLDSEDLNFPFFENHGNAARKFKMKIYTINGLKSTEESQAQSTLYSMKLQNSLEKRPGFINWLLKKVPEVSLFNDVCAKLNQTLKNEKSFLNSRLSDSGGSSIQNPFLTDLLGFREINFEFEPIYELFSLKKCFFETKKVQKKENSQEARQQQIEKINIRYTRENKKHSGSPNHISMKKISISSYNQGIIQNSHSRSKPRKKKSANLNKVLNKNHFKIDLSKVRGRRSQGVNSDRPIYSKGKFDLEKKLFAQQLNYTHREQFAGKNRETKPLSILKVLKKVFYKPSNQSKNQKFAWLNKNSEQSSRGTKEASFPSKKQPRSERQMYVQLGQSKQQQNVPLYLNKPKKKQVPPAPKNTLRSQEDIILKIENVARQKNKENIYHSELISEPLTERNLNIKSGSREKQNKAEQIESGCLSDRSHLKKKSLFSKLTENPITESKYKKIFTFKEEAFESKYLNSLGSSNDILSKVRISFAPNEDPKNIKTSIMDGKLAPLAKHKLDKPSPVEFSTPSGTKTEKISFDLKLDLHSLRNHTIGAKSERNHLKKKIPPRIELKGPNGLDFIPERSSEHNFEGKISMLGKANLDNNIFFHYLKND